MRATAAAHGAAFMIGLVGRETEQQARARQAQPSHLAPGFGPLPLRIWSASCVGQVAQASATPVMQCPLQASTFRSHLPRCDEVPPELIREQGTMAQSNFEIARGQRHHCQRGERLWGLLQSNHPLDRVRPASTVWPTPTDHWARRHSAHRSYI